MRKSIRNLLPHTLVSSLYLPSYHLFINQSICSLCVVAFMAPPYFMSPPKFPRSRSGPSTKPTDNRNFVQARLNMPSYSPPSQPAILIMLEAETMTIEQFRLHGKKIADDRLLAQAW